MSENGLYKEYYGISYAKVAPVFTRCCADVYDKSTGFGRFYQCERKRGHGPDQAYCKQHDPAAIETRRKASDANYREKYNSERYGRYGRAFFAVLQKIADGDNDARALAQSTIDDFMKGMKL